MDRRSRAHQWRRARHNYHDLCPPIGRRTATALLWLSCSIALLRALAASNARAQQRAAAQQQQQQQQQQQRRSFLNAHHRSGAQVYPDSPESESDRETEEVDFEPSLPECLEYEDDFEYETESESESESEIESETDFETETDTAPTTEPETEPEDERGPVVPKQSTFPQSLTERLQALKLRSPDASPSRAGPSTQEPQNTTEGEEPEKTPEPEYQDPRNPEESEESKEKKRQRRCKPKKSPRRDPSPESPKKKGPIPIRRH
ncbi:neuroendocrine secretory protein 55 [Otolemur garnettii]|uniref:GNAS complex locus n=1 Tax=Otolemur garnettii TaxID=30611 RepID=H0XJJ1_OTOGA|nr:neuroendocrine secretory protein 55 [Otolemur garnettii]